MDRSRTLLNRLVDWSPVLLLGGLAALTYWLNEQIVTPGATQDGVLRHTPDTIVENVRAVMFDRAGRPAQTLSAARGEHFADDGTSVLQAPRIALSDPTQPRFDISADRAKVTDDRAHGWFYGNVKAVRGAEPRRTNAKANPKAKANAKAPASSAPNNPSGPVTLTTDYLHITTATRLVDSNQPVTITDEHGIIRGAGINMNLNTRAFTLSGPVSGTIQPQAIPPSP
jgi:lipopolysaccharide export system protein LptC